MHFTNTEITVAVHITILGSEQVIFWIWLGVTYRLYRVLLFT